MKEYELTDEEIVGLIKKTGWGLKRAESFNLISNYTAVTQAAQKKLLIDIDNHVGAILRATDYWQSLLKDFGL